MPIEKKNPQECTPVNPSVKGVPPLPPKLKKKNKFVIKMMARGLTLLSTRIISDHSDHIIGVDELHCARITFIILIVITLPAILWFLFSGKYSKYSTIIKNYSKTQPTTSILPEKESLPMVGVRIAAFLYGAIIFSAYAYTNFMMIPLVPPPAEMILALVAGAFCLWSVFYSIRSLMIEIKIVKHMVVHDAMINTQLYNHEESAQLNDDVPHESSNKED